MKLIKASAVGIEKRRAVGVTAERNTSLIFMKVPRDILKNDCSMYLKILLYMSFAFKASKRLKNLLDSFLCKYFTMTVTAAIDIQSPSKVNPIDETIGERSYCLMLNRSRRMSRLEAESAASSRNRRFCSTLSAICISD